MKKAPIRIGDRFTSGCESWEVIEDNRFGKVTIFCKSKSRFIETTKDQLTGWKREVTP
jgi:hypothetical protein